MKKVIILGCPGSGKSFLSKKLSERTGLPLYHLDNIWWQNDGTHVDRPTFDLRLGEILSREEWIIDGDYSRTYEERISSCDTVIYLDFNEEQCVNGIYERIGKPRNDCPPAVDGGVDELLNEVKKYKEEKRPAFLFLLEKYKNKKIIVFKSRAESDGWVAEI